MKVKWDVRGRKVTRNEIVYESEINKIMLNKRNDIVLCVFEKASHMNDNTEKSV